LATYPQPSHSHTDHNIHQPIRLACLPSSLSGFNFSNFWGNNKYCGSHTTTYNSFPIHNMLCRNTWAVITMTGWSVFWKAVKSFLGWLFFVVIFIWVASATGGFKAYCPLISFVCGSVAVFLALLILGVLMGVWRE
jgi:hypothetical protein